MTDPLVRRMTRRDVLRAVPLVAAAAVVSACSSGTTTDGAAVFDVSGKMPRLDGPALQGGTVEPSLYRGRPVVVNFWATWCGPCRREQPALSAAQAAAGPGGPVFIGVNFRDPDRAAARAYLREFGVRYPSMEDPSGSIAYEFDVPYLPATIFVDATGEMRYRAVGALDERRLGQLIARITTAASPSPSV
jgi:cytochrome c biogenesis protein CcmG, thiol:disulfide interchange protein DsbE